MLKTAHPAVANPRCEPIGQHKTAGPGISELLQLVAACKWVLAFLLLTQFFRPATAQTVTSTLNINGSAGKVAANPVTNKIYVANVSGGSVTVIDGATNNISPIAVGTNPNAIAVNAVTNKIYVANAADGTVTVIDGATGGTKTLTSGTGPNAIAVNPITNQIYVVNEGAPPCYSGSVTVIDGATNNTSTVSLGILPQAIALNPISNKIYVGDIHGVTVIDGVTNATNTVAAGAAAQSIAVNPVTNKIFAANFAANSITVIDGQTNATLSVNVGTNPQAIAVSPVTNQIYVANYLDATVSVIDGSTLNSTIVSVGFGPDALTLDPLTNKIYVASTGSNSVAIIDGGTNIPTSIAVGATPGFLAVNPVTNKLYVSNTGDSTVSVIDMAVDGATTVAVGTSPQASAVNPVTDKIYIANRSSNNVTVFDGITNSTSSVSVGVSPVAVAVNSMTNKIYVANSGSHSVTVVDGATNNAASVPAGNGANAIAVNPVTNKIYVSNGTDNTLTAIDGATNNTMTLPVGTAPVAIAVNQVTGLIYVLNSGSNNLTVVDGTTSNSVTVPVGANPVAIQVNPVTNKIYVANSNGFSVTVIDGNTNSSTTVAVGDTPIAVAVNSVTNKIYVANNGSNNISVIDGPTNNTTTVAVGKAPTAIAANPVLNKVYVVNNSANTLSVVDGIALSTTKIATGSNPAAVSVNQFTNQIYVVNSGSNTITVLQEESVTQMPLTVTVTPLSGDTSTSSSPQFALAASDSTSGASIDNVLFQVDSWQGPWWQAISQGGGSFAGTTVPLQPGLHILYAYSTDGQDAAASSSGYGNSPLLSNIAAYRFIVQSPLQITPLSFNLGQQVLGTSSPTQITTLTNGGTPLSISNISTLGPFSQTNTCGSSLGTSASCTISVNFSPSVMGMARGSLVITDSAPGGGQVLPLVGIGIPVPTTTTLSDSTSSVTSGQPVTFTANVTASSGTPTGTASFLDGGVLLGTTPLNGSGSAQFTTSTLSVGQHVITATYSGDQMFAVSGSNSLNQSVLAVVVVNMTAAGSSVVFNSLADDAISNSAICGTNHWTKSSGGLMHDNRTGLHGLTINDETADVWVTWDGAADGSSASKSCILVAVDSVVAVRGYMAVPRASIEINGGLSGSAGDGLLALLGADSPLPPNVFKTINGGAGPSFPGTTLNIAFSEIRPEDAQYATARSLSKLTVNRSGLGYGDWPSPTTFGSSLIGSPITSSYSPSLSVPCDFEIAPLGFDPISGKTPARWETYPVGVVPMLVIGSNEDNSPIGLGQGLSPGLQGPGPWTAGPYAASGLTRFTAAYLFDGSLTRTTDVLTSGDSLASSCTGTTCGLTQLQREPLAGTSNAFEYSVTRSHSAQLSQEDGVVPGSPNMNPLNIVAPSGGTRLRVLSSKEMVNALCGSSCITPLGGVTPTSNRVGYTFWSYANLRPLAGVHGAGTGQIYNTAPPKAHYFLLDSVDGLFANPGDNPDGALNPPICTAMPCPLIPFTHLIDGSYSAWAIVRAVVDGSHHKGDGTLIDSLLSSLPASAAKFSDYLTMDQMHVFRSHRDANVAGLDARNGNGCGLGYGNDIGQEMGGAIFTIQSDLDYAFDTNGSSNTCLGSSPPDSGLVNSVQ